MAVRRLHTEQPESFAFSRANTAWAKKQIAKYPKGRQASAVIPLLWRVQEQEGWVSEPAIRLVADMLEMPYIRVLEVATFYTMFQLQPVGRKAHVQVCGTTPCMLRGAGDLIDTCKSRIAAHPHELSADGDFSWEEVECLGACVNAPMVQIFADTYEDLTVESFTGLLDAFARGETPEPGPQVERLYSAPAGGLTSLTEPVDPDAREPKSKKRPAGPAAKREKPTTAKARDENIGKPDPEARAEEEAARTPAGAGRKSESDEAQVEVREVQEKRRSRGAAAKTSTAAGEGPAAGDKPKGIKAARGGKADDLKRISGVGPKIEGILHDLGIFHFDQIAAWTPENVEWVDGYLRFRGRITREDWIAQARALSSDGKKGG